MFYRSDGGKYGFPASPDYGLSGPATAPREYDTSEEPIPDLEVERCLVTLPSYLFGYLVRKAESMGLTESEYLTHLLIQHTPEYDLRYWNGSEGPAFPGNTGASVTPGTVCETNDPSEEELSSTIDELVEEFTNRKPNPEMPVFVMYLVEDGQ